MTEPVTQSPDAQPVAYIRRSVVSRSAPGDTSRDMQTEAVRDLAGEDAGRLRVFDGDWGRSASRHELEARTAFAEMVAAIRSGEVTAVYAYAEDRLARDVEAAAHLLNVCERAGVPIVTTHASYPPGDRQARSAFNLQALMNEDFSSQSAEKQSGVVASRLRRGDKLGPPPYGQRIAPHAKGEPIRWERDPSRDPMAVLAAYREAGSFHGAARLLNARSIPAPTGATWYSGSVGRVLHREFPGEFDIRNVQRRVRHGDATDAERVPLFRRLLRCHCGGMLTPTRQQNGTYSYRCNAGYVEPITERVGSRRRSVRPGHPDGITVSERVIRTWAEAESAKWDQLVLETRANVANLSGIDRESLVERRRRAGVAFTMGALNEDELAAEVAEVNDLLATLADQAEARRFLRNRRGVDWTLAPAIIAAQIRRLWSAIHLDTSMQPVRADWRVRPPAPDIEVVA